MPNIKKLNLSSSFLLLFTCVFLVMCGCQTDKEQGQTADKKKGPAKTAKKKQNEPRAAMRPALERPTVLLVILDTVRKDHITPCGYDKPTTPNLKKLAQRGTTFCNMRIPGTWTLPVHASIFTGRFPHEHGADFISDGISVPGFSHLSMSGMNTELPTLAGLFRKAGYQTALVSTNPVLHPAVGLARDFNHVRVYKTFALNKQGAAYHTVDQVLTKELRPDRPLFMVVNISLAHSPYEQVPADAGWTTPTDEVMSPYKHGFFVRLVEGQIPELEAVEVLRKMKSAYDWGVQLADKDLGKTLGVLSKRGWLNDKSVVIVTSDHGELLGEFGLLDHGRTVLHENIDVFAVVQAPGFKAGQLDPRLVQSQDIFPTLLKAAGLKMPAGVKAVALQTPDPKRIAITVNQPDPHWTKIFKGKLGSKHLVAVQQGSRRVVWTDPDQLAEECSVAPGENLKECKVPKELTPIAKEIGTLAKKFTGQRVELPEETVESLRSLGYVQ
jgi:arylsulfatase A-like enzyme